jgi:hypothetical protein
MYYASTYFPHGTFTYISPKDTNSFQTIDP